MGRVETVEAYLTKHLDKLEYVIDQVCDLVPDSYFYTPEIRSGIYLEIRADLECMRRKLTSSAYYGSSSLQMRINLMQKEYEHQLSELAFKKRRFLKEELLVESDEMKVACLISLINVHGLLKYLRTFE